MRSRSRKFTALPLICGAVALAGACSPTVKLEAPDEPIRFDVNINITEQKRLEIDRELLDLIRRNPELFGVKAEDLPAIQPQEPQGSDM
ncbi:YnbE family lipoprotein [Iodidimonas muriae]|nr:YnbE family lipoprotein [Iodidimonas muriae]